MEDCGLLNNEDAWDIINTGATLASPLGSLPTLSAVQFHRLCIHWAVMWWKEDIWNPASPPLCFAVSLKILYEIKFINKNLLVTLEQ